MLGDLNPLDIRRVARPEKGDFAATGLGGSPRSEEIFDDGIWDTGRFGIILFNTYGCIRYFIIPPSVIVGPLVILVASVKLSSDTL